MVKIAQKKLAFTLARVGAVSAKPAVALMESEECILQGAEFRASDHQLNIICYKGNNMH